MSYLLQQLISGIGIGAVYAALGLAVVLVYRTTNIANFAQGEMATFSTFIAWQLNKWGLNVFLAVIVAMAISALIGAFVYTIVVRPVQFKDELTIIIVTLGVFLVFNSASGANWGYLQHSFPSMSPAGGFGSGDFYVSWDNLVIVGVLALVAAGMYLLLQKTKLGLALRAAASHQESSQLVGIPFLKMMTIGWALAAALGALSGALIAPRLTIDPNMMGSILIYAFAGAVVGGMSSYIGAIVGGILVGVVQALSVAFLPWLGSDLQVIVPLLLIIAVLIIKPEGIFGQRTVVRV